MVNGYAVQPSFPKTGHLTGWSTRIAPYNVFSAVEGGQYRGDILSTMRDAQYRGGYQDKRERYLEHRGVFITMGDIMRTVGDVLSTLGDVQYSGKI